MAPKGVGNPFVDAGEKRNAITLCADGITLEGLTAISGSSWWEVGIKVNSSNNSITGDNISNNDDCIYFNSTNNKIFLNNFINSINSAYSYNSTNIWNSTEKNLHLQRQHLHQLHRQLLERFENYRAQSTSPYQMVNGF